MKKIIFLLSVICPLFFSSCEEEKFSFEPYGPQFNVADDPNNPVQHFIYETYRDYGIVILTDPSDADYVYNFNNKNLLEYEVPPQDLDVLQNGVEFVKKTFLNLYADDFKKKNMPFVIMMAKKITVKAFGDNKVVPAYASTGYLAISNIDENTAALTDEQIQEYKSGINAVYWNTFLGSIRGIFSVPKEFYEISPEGGEVNYGSYIYKYKYIGYDPEQPDPDYKLPEPADWYKHGFVNVVDFMVTEDPDWPDFDGYSYTLPFQDQDSEMWMDLLFSTPGDEIEALCQPYDKMQRKYAIMKKALEDAGCDLDLMLQ